MKKNSVVLLSAGLDSTVNFYAALQESNVLLALTFNYGQKAASKEVEYSRRLAEMNNIPHQIVDLTWLKNLGHSALTQEQSSVPTGSKISLDNSQVAQQSAKAVWVPNRNGLFLNVAACYAESHKAELIVPGFNREEAVTFPDNSLDFIRAARKAFLYSTAYGVDVQCYTITMSKAEIVELGKKLNVPFELTWPCYKAEEKWCGECESCQRAKRAFQIGRIDYKPLFLK